MYFVGNGWSLGGGGENTGCPTKLATPKLELVTPTLELVTPTEKCLSVWNWLPLLWNWLPVLKSVRTGYWLLAVRAMRNKAQLCIAAEGGVFEGRKLLRIN